MRVFKEFIFVFNYKVVLVAIISIFATFLCNKFNIIGDMPTSLIGIAVVFPIVFSINSAFLRRDKALELYGNINSNLASIFFAHINWCKFSKKEKSKVRKELLILIIELLESIKKDLIQESYDEKEKKKVYGYFSDISNKNEELRYVGITPTEIQTLNIYLNNIISSFENLSSISDYRTPKGLRAYSKIFLNIFPILFAPYFAKLNVELNFLGYLVAILFSSVLVMLSNIQDNIENPFDLNGLDDIDLSKENRFKNIF